MGYSVEYINCRICGSDNAKLLGIRGNQEYQGAQALINNREHIVTNVVKCRQCGFIYTNPRIALPSESGLNFYNDSSEYLSSVSHDPLRLFDRTLDLIEKFTTHTGRLLDIGAGKGEFLAAAKKRGWEVFGIEPSQNFVKYAKDKYGIDIQWSCPEEANLSESFFDVVTLNMVLEHVENPHNLFMIVNKILKEDGLLYIEVPNMNSGLLKIINLCYRFKGKDWSPFLSPLHPPYHCYGYQKSSLSQLCSLNNFRVKKFFIQGIGLRGFRFRDSDNKFKQYILSLLAGVMSWLKQGDILIAFALKTLK